MIKDGLVVVSRIARPTREEGKHSRPSIGDAVRMTAGYVMDRTGLHRFKPCLPAFVHKDQGAFASSCNVILGAISQGVKMALRHEVFVAHQARFHEGGSPKQAAHCAFRYRAKHLYSVNKLCGIHRIPRRMIAKYALEISQLPTNLLDAFAGEFSGREVNTNGFANHENQSCFLSSSTSLTERRLCVDKLPPFPPYSMIARRRKSPVVCGNLKSV